MSSAELGPMARDGDLLDGVDITDPALYADGDPHAVFAQLRRHRPIQRRVLSDGRPFWSLTRHAETVEVLKNPEVFSTEYGLTLDGIRDDGTDPAANKVLEMCAPARHHQLRQQLAPSYGRGELATLEERVRQFAVSTVDAAVGKGTFDFVSDVADPMACMVVFGLLGLPAEDWELLSQLNKRSELMDPTIRVRPPFKTAADEANHDLLRYLLRRLGADADRLGDGQFRLLQSCTMGDRQLSREEVILNALGIMHAGHGTLRHVASGGMLALIQHPDQHEQLLSDPALLDTFCDEVVRWVTPVVHAARVATCDVELGGVPIKEGDILAAWLISANRDEDVFVQPNQFDLRRQPNRHLAFATGPHVCLGANVARLHLRVLFGELARRMPRLNANGPSERVQSNVMNGLTSLPVTVADAPRSAAP